jgi:hypothetical protein
MYHLLVAGIATGYGVLPTVYKIYNFRLILDGNRPEGVIRHGTRRIRHSSGHVPIIQLEISKYENERTS